MDLSPILTPDSAAELLHCQPETIEERLRTGDLPGEKFGVSWILPTAAFLQRVNEIAIEQAAERRKAPKPGLTVVRGAGARPGPPSLGPR